MNKVLTIKMVLATILTTIAAVLSILTKIPALMIFISICIYFNGFMWGYWFASSEKESEN